MVTTWLCAHQDSAHTKKNQERRNGLERHVSGRSHRNWWSTRSEKKDEEVRDDAKVSDLGDWKNDGVIDKNRDKQTRSWLSVELEVKGGKRQ